MSDAGKRVGTAKTFEKNQVLGVRVRRRNRIDHDLRQQDLRQDGRVIQGRSLREVKIQWHPDAAVAVEPFGDERGFRSSSRLRRP